MKTGTKQAETHYTMTKSLKECELQGDFAQDPLETEAYTNKLLLVIGLWAFNEALFVFTFPNLWGLKARCKA